MGQKPPRHSNPFEEYQAERSVLMTEFTRQEKRLAVSTVLCWVSGILLSLSFLLPAATTQLAILVFLSPLVGILLLVCLWVRATSGGAVAHLSHGLLNNKKCLSRLQRQWDDIPYFSVAVPTSSQSLASDLVLFGKHSLFHFMDRCNTSRGHHSLRDFLLGGTSQTAIGRHGVVRELRDCTVERAKFLAWTSEISVHEANSPVCDHWPAPNANVCRIAWYWTLCVILFVIGLTIGIGLLKVPNDVIGISLMVAFVSHLIATAVISGLIHEQLSIGVISVRSLYAHQEALQSLSRLCQSCPALGAQVGLVPASLATVSQSLRKLRCIMSCANLYRLPLIWFPIQLLSLWDNHALLASSWWHKKYADQLFQCIQKIGEIEALCSLAGMAYDNPEWCFPEQVSDERGVFQAERLGHPLQDSSVCVPNDVVLGPPGSILIITGSNMSGKSTLMRAIGTNMILAQAGGVVCASRMRLSSFTIASSINISDSLELGQSLFMAELKRLKEIVLIAQSAQSRGEACLYLLDEVLHGTNSRERRIATSLILGALSQFQATGIVTTHDTDFAQEMETKANVTNMHLGEYMATINGQNTMTFEYILRSGISQSTNALHLLRSLKFPLLEDF